MWHPFFVSCLISGTWAAANIEILYQHYFGRRADDETEARQPIL